MSKPLGKQQEYMLSEIVSDGGWVEVGPYVCGSNYGGLKRHETMARALADRGLLDLDERPDGLYAKATPMAETVI